jgi:hypothetical protein
MDNEDVNVHAQDSINTFCSHQVDISNVKMCQHCNFLHF